MDMCQADVLKHRQVDLQRKDQLISELEAELVARQQGMEVTNRNHRQLMVRALLSVTCALPVHASLPASATLACDRGWTSDTLLLQVDYDAACTAESDMSAALAAGTAEVSRLQAQVRHLLRS